MTCVHTAIYIEHVTEMLVCVHLYMCVRLMKIAENMENRYMFYVVFLGQGDCVEILILNQIL